MTRAVTVFFGLWMMLGACTQRTVCPAYQSAFIYDKDALRKKFSYFQEDSTPKVYTASKNRYLVAEPMSYHKRLRGLQTIEMKDVPVQVPDSISGKSKKDSVALAEFERAARSVIDSTFIADVPQADTVEEPLDSIYVITKDKELRLLKYNMPDSLLFDPVTQRYVPQAPKYYVKDVRYNMEQDNYMWYMRNNLVLPDVRIAKMQQAEGGEGKDGSDKSDKKKQGLRGFFKNLFRKKEKEQVDSAALKAPVEEEFDFIDEADTVSQAEVPQPGQDKKAKKAKREKKPKVKKEKPARRKKDKNQPDPEAVDPAEKKKEDEDDGF